jgi:AGZA family xanthine/uracil permease-like MFS transporter
MDILWAFRTDLAIHSSLLALPALLHYRQRYAFIAGIGVVTVVSWFRNTGVTFFSDDDAGDARFEYFKQIVRIEGLDKLVLPFTTDLASVALPLFTFFYVDFLGVSCLLLCVCLCACALGVCSND